MVDAIEVYICRNCGLDYDSEIGAQTCCFARKNYKCNKCKDILNIKEEAENCCKDGRRII